MSLKMEVMKGRKSTGGTEGRSRLTTTFSSPDYVIPKTGGVRNRSTDDMSRDKEQQHLGRNLHDHRDKNSTMKLKNKVQIVYYLTRLNGQLQHPHFLEVTHLSSQPLRLKDVIERLAVLRGKAMPSQYSWSCKRSYKNGYVWNDLTENDIIYPSEGSEYVLKGSELIQAIDISENRVVEPEIKARQLGINSNVVKNYKTNGWVRDTPASGVHQGQNSFRQIVMDTSSLAHQGHSFRQEHPDNVERRASKYSAEHNDDDEEDEDQEYEEEEEEEEKTSCSNSSNAPYPPSNISDYPLVLTVQTEQEENYPFQSTSISDKQPLTPPPAKEIVMSTVLSESEAKRSGQKCVTDKGEITAPSALTRNPVLLQLIACGGGSVGSTKDKARSNAKSFNFNTMRSSMIPCLKQQLSTKKERLAKTTAVKMISTNSNSGNYPAPLHREKKVGNYQCEERAIDEDEEDEDMMMVKCMSENPRFGNLQSEEKEYFSGTIIESASSTSAPVITKSSSYNELRGTKGGLQADVPPPTAAAEQDRGRGVIKCIPRMKSCAYTCS